MMFLLLSRDLPPLALAQCLVQACFGIWSADYRTFFPQRQPGQDPQMRWAVATEPTQDLGVVHVTFFPELKSTHSDSKQNDLRRGSAAVLTSWISASCSRQSMNHKRRRSSRLSMQATVSSTQTLLAPLLRQSLSRA
jgi:hypothetical protein